MLQKIAATRRSATAVLVTDRSVDAVERAVLKHLLDDALQLLKLLRSAAKQLGVPEEKAQEAQEQSTKNAKGPTEAEPKSEQHRRKRKRVKNNETIYNL